jgi:CubicO group peptidase (beta-lactamase class C family)
MYQIRLRVTPKLSGLVCAFLLCLPISPVGAQPAGDNPEGRRELPLTWETVEERLDQEAESGFSGVVLLARNGEVALEKAYGLANREDMIANSPETIFAIGSTPIDFTKAGILLLAEQHKLSLDDPISKYFPEIPNDKKSMKIEHLLTGRSGLLDFHESPLDRDPDHTWIDRDEAVRRILGQKLLFAPGSKRRHSHSAWGLLAAVIELVSGESYQDFTRKNLFAPAGMNDTGFFGEPIPKERLAIGYGVRSDGKVNAPPYWGKTSWLVMGSGGQTSTVRDLRRWLIAIHSGKILSDESKVKYLSRPGSILAGGDTYGFGIVYTEGPGNFMIVMTNSNDHTSRERFERLTQALAALVSQSTAPKFSLGIAMAISDEGHVTVDQVVPGSAAEVGGLKPGDILLSANGIPFEGDPGSVLSGPLSDGSPIKFEVERSGKIVTLTAKPTPRR